MGSGEDEPDNNQQQQRKVSQQPLNNPTTSFTDLAQLVCSVRRPIPNEVLDGTYSDKPGFLSLQDRSSVMMLVLFVFSQLILPNQP